MRILALLKSISERSMMSGETALDLLLKTMNPRLQEGEYVFCSIQAQDFNLLANYQALAFFSESEGIALILEREQAEQNGLLYGAIFCWITLSVYSSLNAVGFLAIITSKLAETGIAVNPISAYHHDHLFISKEKTAQAMQVLLSLSNS